MTTATKKSGWDMLLEAASAVGTAYASVEVAKAHAKAGAYQQKADQFTSQKQTPVPTTVGGAGSASSNMWSAGGNSLGLWIGGGLIVLALVFLFYLLPKVN